MRIERIAVRETNCYLLRGEGGTVLIDPGPPGVAAKIVAGATAAGVQPGDVRLIFVTHGHLDHYGIGDGGPGLVWRAGGRLSRRAGV